MTPNSTRQDLENLLASAAERQAATERELAETLDGLRRAVESGGASGGVREAIDGLRESVDALRADLSAAGGAEVAQRLETLPAGLFQGVKEALGPQLDAATAVGPTILQVGEDLKKAVDGLEHTLTTVRGADESRAADIKSLAQSMLELNTGLREWADRIEERISSLAQILLEGVKDLAAGQGRALEALGRTVETSLKDMRQDVSRSMRETTRSLGSRLDDVNTQLTEGEALTGYLRDQIEDMDKALAKIGTAPERLEAAVTQALRRALTVRAGLVSEAEKALERTIRPVEENLERLVDALEAVAEGLPDEPLEGLRRAAAGPAELSGRLDELSEAVLSSLDRLEEQSRERDEILAAAIDRAARGEDPRATGDLRDASDGRRAAPAKRRPRPRRGDEATAAKATSKKAAPKKSAGKKAAGKKASGKQAAAKRKAGGSKSKESGAKNATAKKRKSSKRAADAPSSSRSRKTVRSRSGPYIPV